MESSKQQKRELTVRLGYLVCPNCRRNKRLIRVAPEAKATCLAVFCRDCKKEIRIDMNEGRCYLNPSQSQ